MSNTHDKLVQTTAELLQTQGYHATTMSQVVKESDTPKGSLYYYFPDGKEELAAAAVQQAGGVIAELIAAAAANTETAVAAVEMVVTALSDALLQSDFQKGCPVATLALETAASSATLQQTCRDIYRQWQKPLADSLQSEGWTVAEAQQRAQFVLAAVEGAMLLSKTERTVEPMQTTMQLLKGILTK